MTSQIIIPEVLPPRRKNDTRYRCAYLGDCRTCPALRSHQCAMAQGTVSPEGMKAEIIGFLEEASPFLGLAWGWVLLFGLGVWLFARKGAR